MNDSATAQDSEPKKTWILEKVITNERIITGPELASFSARLKEDNAGSGDRKDVPVSKDDERGVEDSNKITPSDSSIATDAASLQDDQQVLRQTSLVSNEPGREEATQALLATAQFLMNQYQRQRGIGDIIRAVQMLEIAASDTPNEHPIKLDLLNNLATALGYRFEWSGDPTDIDKCVFARQQILSLIHEDHPNKAAYLNNLGVSLKIRYKKLGEPSDIETAISLQQQALALTPDGSSNTPIRLTGLGNSFLCRFERQGEVVDIDNAITSQHEALALVPNAHPLNPTLSHNLAHSYSLRFERLGSLTDLDNAISAWQQALHFPNATSKYMFAERLADCYSKRFERTGTIADIDNVISSRRHLLSLTPFGHPDRANFVNRLGMAFFTLFERWGGLSNINNAIPLLQQAVSLLPDSHPSKPTCINHLALGFSSRSRYTNDQSDMETAITLQEKAISLIPDPDSVGPEHLSSLGYFYSCKFEDQRALADINHAISLQQRGVDLTPDEHPKMALYLTNLGTSLRKRSARLGDIGDLNRAISLQQRVIGLIPDDRERAGPLNSLAIALLQRYKHHGDLLDIDRAISSLQQAVDLVPDDTRNKRMFLDTLGHSYSVRFESLGDFADIDKAISTWEHAISLTPDDDANKPSSLMHLGIALMLRFERLRNLTDIDKAISIQQQIVDQTLDGDTAKSGYFTNLGQSYLRRFEVLKDRDDIENAISAQQQAVAITEDDDGSMPMYLNNLANAYSERFDAIGDGADIDKAISIRQQAISLIPEGHPDKVVYLDNLGGSFKRRFDFSKDPADANNATQAYQQSATSPNGKTSLRYDSARKWAQLCLRLPDTIDSALEAAEVMISLIPQVAWLGRPVNQRFEAVHSGNTGGVATKAAAMACVLGRPDIAVEWLEQGRSVIWGQILHLRTPVDKLQEIDPGLAGKLQTVAVELETGGSDLVADRANYRANTYLEIKAQARRHLAIEWDNLLKNVRSKPGLELFLRPKKVHELKDAAKDSIVVVVNISIRCNALIFRPNSAEVEDVRLQHASHDKLQLALKALVGSLKASGIRQRGITQCLAQSLGTLPRIMTMLWTDIVKPILDHLGFEPRKPGDALPRIIWCPTGPLTFLPLHAAGDYLGTDAQLRVFNCVISSYTPSLTALLKSVKRGALSGGGLGNSGILAVTQSNSKNLPPLPGVLKEIEKLKARIGGRKFELLNGTRATVSGVSDALGKYGTVHFACHAAQDANEPTKSAFILDDGRLDLDTIMKKQLGNAELAYLSACQTATGEETLPEEAIHLAAGMFIAGYASVVATMWSIRDEDAPLVTESFYRRVLGQEGIGVAEALHSAVADLRKKVGESDFTSWVPFIHFGN